MGHNVRKGLQYIQLLAPGEDETNTPTENARNAAVLPTGDEVSCVMQFDSDDSIMDNDYVPSSSRSVSMDYTARHKRSGSLTIDDMEDPSAENGTIVNNPARKYCRRVRMERKFKRYSGEKYVNSSGNVVRERAMKSLGNCRLHCKERFPEHVRQTLFHEYWSLANNSAQTLYLGNLIDTITTKLSRKRDDISPAKRKTRNTTNIFHFKVNGNRLKVCRSCFMKTYDISQMFLTNIIKKTKISLSGVPQPDRRGLSTTSNKHSEETIFTVIQHILAFPSYESHYTRRTCNKKYLPSHLTLQKMYSLYCEENPSKQVSRKIYSREFHKLNLSFKVPQVDTCHKCDTLRVKIQAEKVLKQKQIYEDELKEHHNLADTAYSTKKADKTQAQECSTLRTFVFDLQQCLPTPYLNTSVAFYKRQLWTYNLTIHDLGSGQVKCYMWHEAEGGRGANQIATILYEELMNLPDEVNHVILYSDTCGGQNKNSHVSAMFLCLMQHKKTINIIDHKFMISGHSHMECDVDHGLIEKQKKKSEYPISHPYDWFQLVRTVGKKNKFIVNEMTHDKFLDFASLLKFELVLRKKDSSGDTFNWLKVKWLRYTKTPGEISFKTSLQNDEPFKFLCLLRRGKPNPDLRPQKLYNDTLPISKEKKKDLISLLPLIRPEFHDFYKNLKISDTASDTFPDIEIFDGEN